MAGGNKKPQKNQQKNRIRTCQKDQDAASPTKKKNESWNCASNECQYEQWPKRSAANQTQ